MSANSVSALAYRAREGLRQAFLTQHAAELEEDTCRWTHGQLGAYVRNATSRRDAAKVEDHLDECRSCMAIYLELTEVNSNLGALLGPLVLGGAAAAYLGAAAGGVAAAGRARRRRRTHPRRASPPTAVWRPSPASPPASPSSAGSWRSASPPRTA